MPHDPFPQGLKDPCKHTLSGHAVLIMNGYSPQALARELARRLTAILTAALEPDLVRRGEIWRSETLAGSC